MLPLLLKNGLDASVYVILEALVKLKQYDIVVKKIHLESDKTEFHIKY